MGGGETNALPHCTTVRARNTQSIDSTYGHTNQMRNQTDITEHTFECRGIASTFGQQEIGQYLYPSKISRKQSHDENINKMAPQVTPHPIWRQHPPWPRLSNVIRGRRQQRCQI